ncbi:MerR family transcriptional regulator [Fodinicola acaciae]|uniref:MerR family transcriptional regulator n=1 Tax=Fodinicola acaciae TaxID=2681555 RepID=UPI0013D6B8C1|nr:MerR family transcriptional regulator [Fodinicola acaciae]
MSIGEVARKFGVPTSTLRYYEKLGLLAPAARRGRVRWYGPAQLRRLMLVKLYTDTGLLSLRAVSRIIAAGPRGRASQEVIEQHVEILDQRMEKIRQAQEYLRHHQDCHYPNPSQCPALRDDLQQRVDSLMDGR